MKSMYFFLLATGALLLTSLSCEKDPVIPNPEELITTLIFTLDDLGGGPSRTFSFRDLDGDGGNPPVILTDTLVVGTSYRGMIRLLNESVNPAVEITDEILDEDEDHQFFYQSNGSGLFINYADQDGLGFPVGLETAVSTVSAGSNQLTITLRHLPDKSASGVSEGNIQNAGGETDIEVTFQVVVQ